MNYKIVEINFSVQEETETTGTWDGTDISQLSPKYVTYLVMHITYKFTDPTTPYLFGTYDIEENYKLAEKEVNESGDVTSVTTYQLPFTTADEVMSYANIAVDENIINLKNEFAYNEYIKHSLSTVRSIEGLPERGSPTLEMLEYEYPEVFND